MTDNRRRCTACRRPFAARARPSAMTWGRFAGRLLCTDCQRKEWDKLYPHLTENSRYYQQVLNANP